MSGSKLQTSRMWTVCCVFALCCAGVARADSFVDPTTGVSYQVFEDRQAFLAATQAASVSGPIPNSGGSSAPRRLGQVTISLTPEDQGTVVHFGTSALAGSYGDDFTSLLDGHDIGVTGQEGLTFEFDQVVHAAGFDFAEVTYTPEHAFIDSTFLVQGLSADMQVLFSFELNAPDDEAYFVGVLADTPFLTLKTNEIVGGVENEFYGQIYAGIGAGECVTPGERVTLVELASTAAGDTEFSIEDTNFPGSVTSYSVYRSSDPSLARGNWELLAVGVTDEDATRPYVQWTDTDTQVSPSGIWYYQVAASNDNCPLGSSEGPW